MRIEKTQNLTDAQKETIVRLWNAEYPIQLEFAEIADFDVFLNGTADHRHFLLFDENENLKGWLLTFTRHDERWFSVIVDGSEQKKGYGTTLLNEVKKHESEINGWAIEHDDYLKSDGEKYVSPIGFYRKKGFAILLDIKLEKDDFYAVKIKWTKLGL